MQDETDYQRDDLAKRLRELRERISADYDRRPITKEEWAWACGDEDASDESSASDPEPNHAR